MYIPLTILGLALASTPPTADEAPAADRESRKLYQQGLAHYEREEFDEAVKLFTASFRRSGAPRILYNIGQALRMKGDCAGAAELYHQFIDLVPDSTHRAPAEARLAEMEACVSARRKAAIADLPTALPPPPKVPPPKAKPASELAATSARPHEPVRDVVAGTRDVDASATAGGRPWDAKFWGSFLLGSSLVAGGAAGYFGWRAKEAGEHTSQRYATGGTWDQAAKDNEAMGKSSERAALLLGAGALLTGGVATWMLLQGPSGATTTSGPRVSLGPSLAVVGWSGSY